MKTVGIIAEYNPFHNGHRYQIQTAKQITGADFVIVLMSGNFVQRGTPAIVDKYTRTSMALFGNADMVLELPACYATSSAESFAYGAISIFHKLGFIDEICFGCETPDLSLLNAIADLLLSEPEEYKRQLTAYQRQGFSYPAARQKALIDYFKQHPIETTSSAEWTACIEQPNNILGIAYIQALKALHSSIRPIPIQRTGNTFHSTAIEGTLASATAIRKECLSGKNLQELQPAVPPYVLSALRSQSQKTFPITEDDFSSLLYYKLQQETDYTKYADITEDFSNKLRKTFSFHQSFTTLVEDLKTKDLVYTRICRNLLHILLGITKEDAKWEPEYVRLLGFKKSSSSLIKRTEAISVVTKVADAGKLLSENGLSHFQKDILCSHLYNHICYEKYGYCCKSEYEQSPIILP